MITTDPRYKIVNITDKKVPKATVVPLKDVPVGSYVQFVGTAKPFTREEFSEAAYGRIGALVLHQERNFTIVKRIACDDESEAIVEFQHKDNDPEFVTVLNLKSVELELVFN